MNDAEVIARFRELVARPYNRLSYNQFCSVLGWDPDNLDYGRRKWNEFKVLVQHLGCFDSGTLLRLHAATVEQNSAVGGEQTTGSKPCATQAVE